MTARVHDLSLRLALRRALAGEVRACPALANEAEHERCAEWLAGEPPDATNEDATRGEDNVTASEEDSAEERAEGSTAAARKPPLDA